LPRWQNERRNAWAGSTRKARLPVDWERLRQAVLRRCGNRCEWIEDGFRCHDAATDVDHIARGDVHQLSNLQGLCGRHHGLKTSAEAHAAKAELKKLARLPEEQQPGIIDGPPRPTEHRGF
jgi:5-methylcytosine-specific restriction endonuclease McrA